MIPSDPTRPRIGLACPRADARNKARGQEKYAADWYGPELLWAGVKRSPLAHADLVHMDASAAEELPGVFAVLTAKDVPGPNRQGVVHKDQPVLVDDRVRRVGDPLALVLAETRGTLTRALDLIRVDLAPLPAVFDPEEALAPGAPLVHDSGNGNLLAEVTINKKGDDIDWDALPLQARGRFLTPRQEHAYLETEAGWARLEDDGRIHIVASTQSPYRDVEEVASSLGLPPDRIRVTAPFLGGGFGGKDGVTVQALLALAAMKAQGRPVKMWWDREESFLAGVKRLPAMVDCRLGADGEGRLLALDMDILMDAGAYDHLCGEVLALGAEHASGPYRIPQVRIHGRVAYTHNPPGGPFRGFGVPQVTAALEQVLDDLALTAGLDPAEIRKRNIVRRGDVSGAGVTLIHSNGLDQCLESLCAHPWWTQRNEWKKEAPRFVRRGAGLVCLWHGMGYGPVVADQANAKIELTPEGVFLIDAAVPDMGQGNASAYLQIAADLLGQPARNLTPVLPDTDLTLPSGTSAASRTTYTFGNALIRAAQIMKNRLLEKAAALMMVRDVDEMALIPGGVRHLDSGRTGTLAQIAGRMRPQERIAHGYFRAPVARDRIPAQTRGMFGLPHNLYSYAAHAAFVEVDELTGQVTVVRYLAATDAGRVLNPQVFEQQVQGGIVQGLGFALMEDYLVNQGTALTGDLSTYILPTSLDAPEIKSWAVETWEDTGPFGSKGLGEIPINGPLPAIGNALTDAIGVRIRQAPIIPARVLAALSGGNDVPLPPSPDADPSSTAPNQGACGTGGSLAANHTR